jgi:pantoate--beta-alanine ligase
MILFRKASDLRDFLLKPRLNGQTIGFVPTMGALHDGHLELIRAAKNGSDILVVSIFVNPTQFNDPADFKKYPVTIEADIQLLESAKTDILFYPTIDGLYPTGTNELEHYELGFLETILEGTSRPGHFQGVCQVMNRLLEAVQPNDLFMGQKDYQQCMVVKELCRQQNLQLRFHTIPTVREQDGLAMSSRNRRLTETDRKKAPSIFKSMNMIREELKPGDTEDARKKAVNFLEISGFRVDYISIADADTLEPITDWDGEQQIAILVAAFLGDVRLIDNLLLTR